MKIKPLRLHTKLMQMLGLSAILLLNTANELLQQKVKAYGGTQAAGKHGLPPDPAWTWALILLSLLIVLELWRCKSLFRFFSR